MTSSGPPIASGCRSWTAPTSRASGASTGRSTAARLLRDPDRYVAEFGEANYQVMLGDCLWHVYRMIGKLTGVALVFA